MSSAGDFPNPLKVEKPYRKFGFCLFAALVTGAVVVTVLSIWSVVSLVKQNIVEQQIQATTPFLPYIYICSSAPNTYNLTGAIYTAAGDDIADPTLSIVNTADGGNERTDGTSIQQLVTVQIMNRILNAPQATQCVSFKLNPAGPTDIPWQGQVSVMYPRAVYQSTLSATEQAFLGLGMNVYFSDYGGDALVKNQFFLRDRKEIFQKDNSKEKFEEGATFLTPFARTTMQIQKVNNIYANGGKVVKYPAYGALTTTPLPGVVDGLVGLHNVPASQVASSNFSAVVLAVSISYDEVTLQEKNLVAIIFTLIGSIPGYISYIFLIWYFFFEADLPEPEYTIASWLRKGTSMARGISKKGGRRDNRMAAEVEAVEQKRLALSRGNSAEVPADV